MIEKEKKSPAAKRREKLREAHRLLERLTDQFNNASEDEPITGEMAMDAQSLYAAMDALWKMDRGK